MTAGTTGLWLRWAADAAAGTANATTAVAMNAAAARTAGAVATAAAEPAAAGIAVTTSADTAHTVDAAAAGTATAAGTTATATADSAVRLFCLPHAGSGPARYLRWADRLPGIDLIGVCLPGHERRVVEPPLRRVVDIVDALADAMAPHLDRPFALLGHSFGGLLAFELARRLEADGARPLHLFISGAAPAPSRSADPPVRTLTDPAFLTHVRRLGGLDPDVLAHPDLVDLVTPALRADYEAAEAHTRTPPRP
ncbi:thioesterase II family protein [Catenulispora yoronensis]